jgi:HEPN domain-containing protein
MIGTASDWLAKARDDLRTVELLLTFDDYPRVIAAFHCQQAVEKSLKAFLTTFGVPFLYRHDLGYLLDLCLDIDPACAELEPQIDGLTPYAVEMRYPTDLPVIPTASEVEQFYHQAKTVYEFVEDRIASS